jgi:hypothetical protein
MRRTAVLLMAMVFIIGFGALTIAATAEQGLSAAGVLSILILLMLAVGIIGAMRNPPR